jgi:hypothetical protein
MTAARDPAWWSEEHTGAWDRIKTAFRRDWEQTKNDLRGSTGRDLNQNAADTIKQAAGSEPIPPGNQPTRPDEPDDRPTAGDWDRDESAHRYGFGARSHYGPEHKEWDDRLESRLREEWTDLRTGKTWDETRAAVRRGWDRARD